MSATATATKASYRKTKTGEWVVYAPVEAFAEHPINDEKFVCWITVTKSNGERQIDHIARIGKAFTVDGTDMAYGYIHADSAYIDGRSNNRRTVNAYEAAGTWGGRAL